VPAKPYVSIVIPTLNEVGNIRPLVRGIRSVMKGYKYEIIVVDGRSSDGTDRVARSVGARVVYDTRGKGGALMKGFKESRGRILIAMDADLSNRPEELKLLIAGIETGYDMCAGSRFITGGGSDDITPIRRFGGKALVFMINVLYGTHFTDMSYGYKAFTKDAIRRLRLTELREGIEPEMHARAARVGLKVIEVPSFEKRRAWGDAKMRTIKMGTATVRTILKNVNSPR